MAIRLWLNIGSVFALGIMSFQIMKSEQVEIIEKKSEKADLYPDDLRDLVYSKDNRVKNLEKFGLTKGDLEYARKYANGITKRKSKREQIKKMLIESDKKLMRDIFCNRDPSRRARYAAVRVLMTEQDRKYSSYRGVLDLTIYNGELEEQQWVEGSIIYTDLTAIYQDLENVSDSEDDATLMFVASLVAQKEEALKNRTNPWGSGSSWSWTSVKKDYPGASKIAARYLALMHVFTEVAQVNICQ